MSIHIVQDNREELGQTVREVWIAWAKEQRFPKPSWLIQWDDLSEPEKEVDRRIGETLFAMGNAKIEEQAETLGDDLLAIIRHLIDELARMKRDAEDWKRSYNLEKARVKELEVYRDVCNHTIEEDEKYQKQLEDRIRDLTGKTP